MPILFRILDLHTTKYMNGVPFFRTQLIENSCSFSLNQQIRLTPLQSVSLLVKSLFYFFCKTAKLCAINDNAYYFRYFRFCHEKPFFEFGLPISMNR